MTVKNKIIGFFKSEFVKLALVKILKHQAAGGIKAWLVKLLAEHLFDEVVEPAAKFAFRKLGYLYDRVEGEILVKKLEGAKDEQEHDSIVRDILS